MENNRTFWKDQFNKLAGLVKRQVLEGALVKSIILCNNFEQ